MRISDWSSDVCSSDLPMEGVVDPEVAVTGQSTPVHQDHGSNVLFRKTWVWGDVDGEFAGAQHTITYRARWNRNSTVPIETFGVAAQWSESNQLLDVWASIQMPKYPDQLAAALRLPGTAVREIGRAPV